MLVIETLKSKISDFLNNNACFCLQQYGIYFTQMSHLEVLICFLCFYYNWFLFSPLREVWCKTDAESILKKNLFSNFVEVEIPTIKSATQLSMIYMTPKYRENYLISVQLAAGWF